MSSVNSLAVVCEKHQVLPTEQRRRVKNVKNVKVKNTAGVFFKRCSYSITEFGDDGVQVLDFTFQQHHPGTLSAVLVRMVQHHVEKVTQLGGDA